ncbi:MAG: hypothetical protein VX350_07800 [Pseudomonadota bacterium]|nr:hypothetical protein [Pseudomonadota bacterium]
MAIRIKSQATRSDFCRFSSYGFDGNMLRDVGEHIGLTREIVRQIQLKELNCLKAKIAGEGVASSLLSELGWDIWIDFLNCGLLINL